MATAAISHSFHPPSELYAPEVAVGILLSPLFFKGDAVIHETGEPWNNETVLQKSLLFQTGLSESATDLTSRAFSRLQISGCLTAVISLSAPVFCFMIIFFLIAEHLLFRDTT